MNKIIMKTIQEKQANIFKELSDEFGYTNEMEVPRIEKLVISSGIGSITDPDKVSIVEDRLARITGQKPVPTRAKQSIASFNVRAGDVTGYKVTLRGKRARSFVDKLIHVALPRTKDFRGLDPESVDEMGNLSIGISEHTIFPATSDEEIKDVFGLGVTVVTSAENAEEAQTYLAELGLPFKDEEDSEE